LSRKSVGSGELCLLNEEFFLTIFNQDIKSQRLLPLMLGTNSSISQVIVMENDKIEVYNYLDVNAVINNSIIKVFSIKKLPKAFPEMDYITLKDFETEWRKERQRMLDLKFDFK
jgi:hypothetical protein